MIYEIYDGNGELSHAVTKLERARSICIRMNHNKEPKDYWFFLRRKTEL